ncbi:MAG: hypothetical protein BGO41_03970 [Clostridiales bacterium 38-18]|nr:MAG: hypothetical protein BGO41_03970 [Clostridiales bacterium 38-18]
MNYKYTILAVAYKDVEPEIEAKISQYSIRMIDETDDLVNYCTYGRQFDQDSRVCIYLEWYQNNILKYLSEGYKIVLLEIPYNSNEPIVKALENVDIELGDKVLIIEHDNV